MKKGNFYLMACLFTMLTLFFVSCDKDKDNDKNSNNSNVSKIIATDVINGLPEITTVKAKIYWENGEGFDAIAQAPYENNGFTLMLPNNLPANFLGPLFNFGEGVTISDKNALVSTCIYFKAYNKGNNEIGYFMYRQTSGEYEEFNTAEWMYVDRDLTVKGERKYTDYDEYDDTTYEFSCKYIDYKLKKGWNIVYGSYTEIYYDDATRTHKTSFTVTTQKPSNVNYNWYFY